MPISVSEQQQRLRAAQEEWAAASRSDVLAGYRGMSNAVSRVRELEGATVIVHGGVREDMKNGYWSELAIKGYQAWVHAFEALDTTLTNANRAALDKVITIMDALNTDAQMLTKPSSNELNTYFDAKMEQLNRTGETYILSGYDRHFNITRIRRLSDGSYTHMLFDAGAETQALHYEYDNQGQKRTVANVIEERAIKRGIDPRSIIEAETAKLTSSEGSKIYKEVDAQIERGLKKEPIYALEEYAQRRGNCTTRGQRLLVNYLLDDKGVSQNLREFITDNAVSPDNIRQQLESREKLLRIAPKNVRMDSNHFIWDDYQSGQFGDSLRYSHSFRNDTEKEAFTKDMAERGVNVKWGVRGGKNYAYIPKTDAHSMQALDRFLEGQRPVAPLPEPELHTGERAKWNPYESSMFGGTMRYERAFTNEAEKTAFTREMASHNITIRWGKRDGASWAYVSRSDAASMHALGEFVTRLAEPPSLWSRVTERIGTMFGLGRAVNHAFIGAQAVDGVAGLYLDHRDARQLLEKANDDFKLKLSDAAKQELRTYVRVRSFSRR